MHANTNPKWKWKWIGVACGGELNKFVFEIRRPPPPSIYRESIFQKQKPPKKRSEKKKVCVSGARQIFGCHSQNGMCYCVRACMNVANKLVQNTQRQLIELFQIVKRMGVCLYYIVSIHSLYLSIYLANCFFSSSSFFLSSEIDIKFCRTKNRIIGR